MKRKNYSKELKAKVALAALKGHQTVQFWFLKPQAGVVPLIQKLAYPLLKSYGLSGFLFINHSLNKLPFKITYILAKKLNN